ncbi:MAG: hypothetical protein HY017_04170 [Betaproteobacteria bacterium]|nr:hypothetical protein [Betaproteobacteria bacterium]
MRIGSAPLRAWDESEDGFTHSIRTVFPTLVVRFNRTSLAARYLDARDAVLGDT